MTVATAFAASWKPFVASNRITITSEKISNPTASADAGSS